MMGEQGTMGNLLATVKMAAEASRAEQVNFAAEFNLLPRIFDIVQSLQKASDPQETTKKITAFRNKLQNCRDLLDKNPALDMSCNEQKLLLQKYKQEYRNKCDLLTKYKNLPLFADSITKEIS